MSKAGDKIVVLAPKDDSAQANQFALPAGVEPTRYAHEDLVGGKIPLENSSVDAVFSLGSAAAHSIALLDEVVRVLKPGSQFVMREVVSKAATSGASHRIAKDLFTACTLAGLVNSSLKLVDAGSNLVEVAASKPKFEVGASVGLKRPAGAATKVWTISADNDAVEPAVGKSLMPVWASVASDDLIDENSLLNEEDLASLAKRPIKNDDCGTGSTGARKACKNCTCGRAEEEAGVKKPPPPTEAAKSSCGNCGLGDAFRCSGCPYRGLPPFKPGEKVTIQI